MPINVHSRLTHIPQQFSASLHHPISSHLPSYLSEQRGGVLWVRAQFPSSDSSPRTARQISITVYSLIICKCELVKQTRTDIQRVLAEGTEAVTVCFRGCFIVSWSMLSPTCDVSLFHWTD